MHEDGLVWAEGILGTAITEVVELSGGLTSTMLALTDASGSQAVLRLMTKYPWRAHGAGLTRRERAALETLASASVPAATSLALDAEGVIAGVAAHLMSRLPGTSATDLDGDRVALMAKTLAEIHEVKPAGQFRTFQSWAWAAKWVVPAWTRHPASWRRAFEILAGEAPSYVPTFLHRDFSHRNLLWRDGEVSGVVDWVETSIGPSWLDAAHAATNLALDVGPASATAFLGQYAALASEAPHHFWLLMDAVGFLPAPGRAPLFGTTIQLQRLDEWVHELVDGATV